MIDLTNVAHVRELKGNMRATLDTDAGKEVMRFLEQLCGWYDFSAVETDQIILAHGKRQVLATIKTLLEFTPDEIVAITKEQNNG